MTKKIVAFACIEYKYTDEMLCDLAQYYHIYNYKEFSMPYIATLVCGLPSDSRVLKAISGKEWTIDQMLLAQATDRLSLLWWAKTKDGQKNRNRPQMFTQMLMNTQEEPKQMGFDSAEDFEEMRARIIKEKNNG